LLDKAIRGQADFGTLPLDRPISGEKALQIIAARASVPPEG
jgi:leucyl/phenylalanyl-tRNA--protein transferase